MYHPHIYIVVLGNDAFPFSQQINKSDRFVVCSYFFFIVYVERKKTSKIQSLNVNISIDIFIYTVAFLMLISSMFPLNVFDLKV
jgi:hypothetical protein